MYVVVLGVFLPWILIFFGCVLQHASQDVDKMILGNKCDMNDKRVVSKEKGESVSTQTLRHVHVYYFE